MAILLETGQTAKREDLADLLSRIDAKGTPLSSMIPKGQEPTNTLFEWVVDDHEAPASAGHVDGLDFASGDYGNMSPNRAKCAGRVQVFQKPFGVSLLAEEVSDVAGVGRKAEMRESIKKALVSVKRGIEVRISDENDSQADAGTGASGSNAYLTRGLFSWVGYTGGTSAQPSDQAIPSGFTTPAASIKTPAAATLSADFDEGDIQDILESLFNTTGGNSSFALVCGTKLKRRFTDFTTYQSGLNSSTQVALRTYNQDSSSKKVISTVDVFIGDFGQVDLIPSHWLRDSATDAKSAASGLVLDTSLLKLRYNSLPSFQEVEDRGGGKKGFIRAICGLQVTNPTGLGAIVAS